MWDTKGWIAFKRGDLDAAQEWIVPAWLASGRGDEAEHLGEVYEKLGKRDEAIRYYIDALAVESPSAEARTRLTALGVTKDLDGKVSDARREMEQQRNIALDHSDKGSAEFFLLVAPDKVEQVKFIKGDADLKALSDTLEKTAVKMVFPKGSQVHVPRRASVKCGAVPTKHKSVPKKKDDDGNSASGTEAAPGPCVLQMAPADSVRGLD
jgi:tetratricopeptide (TPR) repeat protein